LRVNRELACMLPDAQYAKKVHLNLYPNKKLFKEKKRKRD
jgi:hypothetical protein